MSAMTTWRITPASVLFLLALVWIAAAPAFGQGSKADYERAARVRAESRGQVRGGSVEPRWIDDGAALWFQRALPDQRCEYVHVDARTGAMRPLFDHAALTQAVKDAGGPGLDPTALSLEHLTRAADGTLLVMARGSDGLWRFDPATGEASAARLEDDPAFLLEPVARVPRSRDRGGETAVVFINRLDVEVVLFWKDREGRRQSYGRLAPGAQRRQHTFAGHAWVAADLDGTRIAGFVAGRSPGAAVIDADIAPPVTRSETPRRTPGLAPDGSCRVRFEDHNIVLEDVATGATTTLTTDGVHGDAYAGPIAWSPTSTHAVVMRRVAAQERTVHIVESAPRDQTQPKLVSFNYLKPGDRVAKATPVVIDVAAKTATVIDDALFPNPWSVQGVEWRADGSGFTFLYNQRGHQVLRLIAVDTDTATPRMLIDETSPTFINYSNKTFRHHRRDADEVIWMSERDGWNHLYLHDASTGELKNAITAGQWVVRSVERVDEAAGEVWFWAHGAHAGQDPYHRHLGRVKLDGTGLTWLTDGDGTYDVAFAPDGNTFIATYSRVDLPPVTELRRASDGAVLSVIERADATELFTSGWRAPERFVAKGRDGTTDIWGLIYRPRGFDPAASYPVVEQIYAGPHGQHVPKAWGPTRFPHVMAELGFIVVQIDGMGTNWRSKAFHDVCWKNLGDAGFPDRIAWMRAAAAHEPAMDLERVGIYGGSAGGQNAMRALIAHGDFYDAAVADCGCHDNRMDKIWWNEAWMGWPIDGSYEASSNVAQAHRMDGALLLIVGELDRNVDPASTMQVVDALIRADKDFELLVIPGAGHGAAGTAYGARRQKDFLVRELLGVEPRWE